MKILKNKGDEIIESASLNVENNARTVPEIRVLFPLIFCIVL